MPTRIPIVDYLVLEDGPPHLTAHACRACGALYFDRRNACGRCSGRAFARQRLETSGRVRSFTIVRRAAPGVPTPFISVVVDLDGGGSVKANLLGVETSAAAVKIGAPVRLTTFVAATDDDDTEAVAFGFETA